MARLSQRVAITNLHIPWLMFGWDGGVVSDFVFTCIVWVKSSMFAGAGV